MTEQELIKKLQSFKQIKPRPEWVVLSKNKILKNSPVMQPAQAQFASTSGSIFQALFSRKLAYSLAVLFIAVLGVAGWMNYGALKGNNQKAVVLSAEVRTNLEKFKTTSKDLALVAKTNPKNIAVIENQVKEAAQALTDAIKKDPQVAKEIALDVNNNKTYLEGAPEANEASINLEKALAEQIYSDYKLNEKNLTDEERGQLPGIRALLDEGNSSGALVNLLLLKRPAQEGK